MKQKKRRKKWLRFRHRVVRNLAYMVMYPYARIKYGLHVEKFREQTAPAYLILLNHQTPMDQFFVGMAFKGPVYYLATEDIFSMGWVSSLIRWLVAPIPIKKQAADPGAVMNCLRVAREGGTICIAPEGNRTYSGKTEYMNASIAALAKKINLPIALCRLEGGYGVQPRWSDSVRKGKMRCYVAEVITPEEYGQMTNDELFRRIQTGLFVDEAKADGIFKSENRAEYLERAIYVCPKCGLSHFESSGNEIACKTCGAAVTYGEDKRLTGVGFDFPFPFVSQWYDYQKDFVNALDVMQYTQTPLFRETGELWEVMLGKQKNQLREQASLALYGDRIAVDEGTETELVLPFERVYAAAVLGRNKLNVYIDSQVYQFRGSPRFNALKYVNIYYRYKNISRGDTDGKFLGL